MPIRNTQGTFNTGRDVDVVIVGPFGQIDLQNVTGFRVQQVTAPVKVDRLDGIQLDAELPKGWSGQLDCDRGNSALDDVTAAAEDQWLAGGDYQNSTLFQYVREAGGSTSCYAYDNVCLKLADAGDYRPDAAVKQQLHFSANRRRRV